MMIGWRREEKKRKEKKRKEKKRKEKIYKDSTPPVKSNKILIIDQPIVDFLL